MEARGKFHDYVCGGYFVAKAGRYYRKSDLVPGPIITVSTCIAKTLPGDWQFEQVAMTTQERKEAALDDGIDVSDVDHLVAWTTDRLSRKRSGILTSCSRRRGWLTICSRN